MKAISISLWSLKRLTLLGEKSFDELLAIIADMGVTQFDLMEDYVPCHPHTDLHELRKLRKQIDRSGLQVNSCWYYTDLVGGVYSSSFDGVVSDMRELLAVTGELGSTFLTGPVGVGPASVSLEDGIQLLTRIYEEIVPTAEEYNVRIALESARTFGLKTPQVGLGLVKAIGSRYLTVTPDFEAWRVPTDAIPAAHVELPGAAATGPVPLDVFEQCLPYAPLIHAKMLSIDETGNEPNFPLGALMGMVKKSPDDHVLSLEYEGWIPDINPHLDPVTETKKALALLQKYLN